MSRVLFSRSMKAQAATQEKRDATDKDPRCQLSFTLPTHVFLPLARIARAADSSITRVLMQYLEADVDYLTKLSLEMEKMAPKERLAKDLYAIKGRYKKRDKPDEKSLRAFVEEKKKSIKK